MQMKKIAMLLLIFTYSCEIPNNPVQLLSLTSTHDFAWSGDVVTFVCKAQDSDDDKLSYVWSSPSGDLITKKDSAFWTAPDTLGFYHVTCKISDGVGSSQIATATVRVVNSGFVINGISSSAIDGLPVKDVNVSISELFDVTDEQGNFSLYIPNIPDSITIFGEKNSFCDFIGKFVVPENYNEKIFTYNFSISPIPSTGEIRFVLNWSESPGDLDSHLRTPQIDSTNFHIYYGNRGSDESSPYVILDVDDVDGYGPETITIKQTFNGTYLYYIHNYTGGNFPESNGVVRIYNSPSCGGEVISIPKQGNGRYWYVCDINGENGEIEIRNQIVEYEPGT